MKQPGKGLESTNRWRQRGPSAASPALNGGDAHNGASQARRTVRSAGDGVVAAPPLLLLNATGVANGGGHDTSVNRRPVGLLSLALFPAYASAVRAPPMSVAPATRGLLPAGATTKGGHRKALSLTPMAMVAPSFAQRQPLRDSLPTGAAGTEERGAFLDDDDDLGAGGPADSAAVTTTEDSFDLFDAADASSGSSSKGSSTTADDTDDDDDPTRATQTLGEVAALSSTPPSRSKKHLTASLVLAARVTRLLPPAPASPPATTKCAANGNAAAAEIVVVEPITIDSNNDDHTVSTRNVDGDDVAVGDGEAIELCGVESDADDDEGSSEEIADLRRQIAVALMSGARAEEGDRTTDPPTHLHHEEGYLDEPSVDDQRDASVKRSSQDDGDDEGDVEEAEEDCGSGRRSDGPADASSARSSRNEEEGGADDDYEDCNSGQRDEGRDDDDAGFDGGLDLDAQRAQLALEREDRHQRYCQEMTSMATLDGECRRVSLRLILHEAHRAHRAAKSSKGDVRALSDRQFEKIASDLESCMELEGHATALRNISCMCLWNPSNCARQFGDHEGERARREVNMRRTITALRMQALTGGSALFLKTPGVASSSSSTSSSLVDDDASSLSNATPRWTVE